MATPPTGAIGFVTDGFPAPGLTRTRRHITGHNEEGKSVFLTTDSGDHHRVMGEQQAVANILYSTMETPIELNGNVDIQHAKEHEVSCPSFSNNCARWKRLIDVNSRHFTTIMGLCSA